MALFAVGAKAQFLPYPYSAPPYQSVYSPPVVVLGGGQAVAVAPTVTFAPYGLLPYYGSVVPPIVPAVVPSVVSYGSIVSPIVPSVFHYGFYRNPYYGYW